MKTNHVWIILAVLLTSLKSFSWKEFHGGDHVMIQWNMLAAGIMADADKVPTLRKYSDLFLNTYFTIRIITTDDDLEIDGIDKVALFEIDHNLANKTLYIQVNRWEKMSRDEREYLVIHELLNMSGLIDDDYHYSQEIYSKLKEARPILEKFNSILNYVYVGLKDCQIENYRSVNHLIVEKESLESIITYIDMNPQLCPLSRNLANRVRQIIKQVYHE